MGKFFRFIFYIILVLAAVIVVLGIIEPKNTDIQRSTTIAAPQDVVFNQIVNLKNWVNWSPWYKAEPNMSVTYTGLDGTPGSSYYWVGKKTGEGSLTDTAIKNGEMDFVLNFIKPMKSKANGSFVIASLPDGQTKVTWSLHSHFPFPVNAALAFMDIDKLLGGELENGLHNMKGYTEKLAAANPFQIKDTVFAAHTYMGFRKMINWNDMKQFFADSYGKIGQAAGASINGSAAAIYYSFDTVHNTADMAAVMPVSDTLKHLAGGEYIYIPQSKAYMLIDKGSYTTLPAVHNAMKKYLAGKGAHQKLAIEEYVIGPAQEKDSTKWITNVYYITD